jgi:hypothetical protein
MTSVSAAPLGWATVAHSISTAAAVRIGSPTSRGNSSDAKAFRGAQEIEIELGIRIIPSIDLDRWGRANSTLHPGHWGDNKKLREDRQLKLGYRRGRITQDSVKQKDNPKEEHPQRNYNAETPGSGGRYAT